MSDRQNNKNIWFDGLLLLVWTSVGLGLRFANLGAKSPSSIEISTLGFSLGHGFSGIPLDRAIAIDTLLSPLKLDPTINPGDVIHRLVTESNHPPLYFVLGHFWLKLWAWGDEIDALWVARSLSALFGVMAIPAIFGLCRLAFRSQVVAQIAAALMAVSPYGIYLAQEARHYTLSILWIIASLSCLVAATIHQNRRTIIPIWLVCVWIIINSLGVATHYLFSLVLGAEGLVIAGFCLNDFINHSKGNRKDKQPQSFTEVGSKNSSLSSLFPLSSLSSKGRWRIYAVGLGTLVGALVWLPVARNVSDNELTDWIQTSFQLSDLWEPIPRLFAWWITMIFLLPVEGTPFVVTVVSGAIALLVLSRLLPAIFRGIKIQIATPSSRLSLLILGGFLLSAIAIFLAIIYGYGKDLSKAARYHFVYFPAAIAIVGAALAVHWQQEKQNLFSSLLKATGKPIVIFVLVMGLLGGMTVVTNYGYQKSKQADRLAAQIQEISKVPILIAMTYESHAQLRTLMALGVEFKRSSVSLNVPQFLLLRGNGDNSDATISKLKTILNRLPKPLDLWGVDFSIDSDDLEAFECEKDDRNFPGYGYRYWLSHCR
ncbi:MAG: glycosyltransferase [Hydrococcus sp. Prado102]|jgi:uncharacterized membrane protein|nr:glycosyltransferase [Hydrococcus sp. Prado102]